MTKISMQKSELKKSQKAGILAVMPWRKTVPHKLPPLNGTDFGWIIMCIGMSIGAGIAFLPVEIGLVGFWPFLLASLLGYPGLYLFQRLFLNTLCLAPECHDYPAVISQYLGKNWGIGIGCIYFTITFMFALVYSTTITHDSASFVQTLGLINDLLARHWWYSLAVVVGLVFVASRGERLLVKISTVFVLLKLLIILLFGVAVIPYWDFHNIGPFPRLSTLVINAVKILPFTITSLLFLMILCPLVSSYRAQNAPHIGRLKALRVMKDAYTIVTGIVGFYALSFCLTFNHAAALDARGHNISALAQVAILMTGQGPQGALVQLLSLVLSIAAVMTAFFSVFMSFRESLQGVVVNLLSRIMPQEKINIKIVSKGVLIFAVLTCWLAGLLRIPVLRCIPISGLLFGLVGCIIPVYLVCRVPALSVYKGLGAWYVLATGIFLIAACLGSFFL